LGFHAACLPSPKAQFPVFSLHDCHAAVIFMHSEARSLRLYHLPLWWLVLVSCSFNFKNSKAECCMKGAKVNRHLHSYLRSLEWDLLKVTFFNPGNVKFRLGDPYIFLEPKIHDV
jgi:hypothetical protein